MKPSDVYVMHKWVLYKCLFVDPLKYKCGKCGWGNVFPGIGCKCRVCKAKVFDVINFDDFKPHYPTSLRYS